MITLGAYIVERHLRGFISIDELAIAIDAGIRDALLQERELLAESCNRAAERLSPKSSDVGNTLNAMADALKDVPPTVICVPNPVWPL